MESILVQAVGWVYPLIILVVIIMAAIRNFPGKPWLIIHLVLSLVVTIAWRVPGLIMVFDVDFDLSGFYKYAGIPLSLMGIIGLCMLIPFVLVVSGTGQGISVQRATGAQLSGRPGPPPLPNTDSQTPVQ